MTKLFRGGELNDTALLARESLQNSTDAARAFAASNPGVSLRVVFRFVHLFGDEKAAAVEALDLHGLADRRAEYETDPLQPQNALDTLDDPRVPLRLLFVEDFGTHGLYGSTRIGKKSHLFKAMYYLGSSDKAADAGGSYGFGKSALMRASRIRSVIAHSTFEQYEDDPVRTRLVGFTWWPDLQDGDTLWNGRLSFAEKTPNPNGADFSAPFEDDKANGIADALGFELRNFNDPRELGTSFLVIDPTIEPEALVEEIERWWWPALEENKLDAQVVLPSGDVRTPRPATNPFVAEFLRAFRIATHLDAPGDPNQERLPSADWRDRSGLGGKDLGSLALVVSGTNADEAGEDFERAPVVALVRGPRMVIAYNTVGRSRVPIRGVFVASDKADRLLRDTEPSSHDRWTVNASADLATEATETARTVLDKIRSAVRKMASEIVPAPPKTNRALAHFSKLMSGFLGNKRGGGAGGKPGGERIELHFPSGRPEPVVLNEELVRIDSVFSVRVADDAASNACEVQVVCHLFISEDDSQSRSTLPLVIRPVDLDSGFTPNDDGSWTGVITREDRVAFAVTSDAYPNLWTTSLQPTVTRTSDWKDA